LIQQLHGMNDTGLASINATSLWVDRVV